jgi:hypothetical protein
VTAWPLLVDAAVVASLSAWAAVQWRRAIPRLGPLPPEPEPRDLDTLVRALRDDAWTTLYVPSREEPRALVWLRLREGVADVVQILDELPGRVEGERLSSAYAYRVAIEPEDDLLAPTGPLLWYVWHPDARWVIEQALALPAPDADDAPRGALARPPVGGVVPRLLAESRRHVRRPAQ